MKKKIKVPEEMVEAASPCAPDGIRAVLEAALEWLSENPIRPTDDQVKHLSRRLRELDTMKHRFEAYPIVAVEWQRIMFFQDQEDDFERDCGTLVAEWKEKPYESFAVGQLRLAYERGYDAASRKTEGEKRS